MREPIIGTLRFFIINGEFYLFCTKCIVEESNAMFAMAMNRRK